MFEPTLEPPPEPQISPTPTASPLVRRIQGAVLWIGRYRLLLAMFSFGAGAFTFINMQRSQALAQWLAVLLGAGWLLMLIEVPLNRWFARFHWSHLSQPIMRYAVQNLHQYTLFFCLPILFYTTTWHSGQALFTGSVVAAALCAMWDPIYYGVIAPRPWLYFALHAFTVYIAALTVPPILWQLTTTQSLALASVAIGVFALPSLINRFERRHWLRWALLLVMAVGLGGMSWLLRFWVPPATLWVSQPVITRTLDADQRDPGAPLKTISTTQLHAGGLYAYAAIHAPRGLREQVFHVWRHNGVEMDRIPLKITGGRKQGYRAWSYKQSFPKDATGEWRVEVVTNADQLIGELRFLVVPAVADQPATDRVAHAQSTASPPVAQSSIVKPEAATTVSSPSPASALSTPQAPTSLSTPSIHPAGPSPRQPSQ